MSEIEQQIAQRFEDAVAAVYPKTIAEASRQAIRAGAEVAEHLAAEVDRLQQENERLTNALAMQAEEHAEVHGEALVEIARLTEALRRSDAKWMARATKAVDEERARLASMCRNIGRMNPDDPMKAGCHYAADMIDMHKPPVWLSSGTLGSLPEPAAALESPEQADNPDCDHGGNPTTDGFCTYCRPESPAERSFGAEGTLLAEIARLTEALSQLRDQIGRVTRERDEWEANEQTMAAEADHLRAEMEAQGTGRQRARRCVGSLPLEMGAQFDADQDRLDRSLAAALESPEPPSPPLDQREARRRAGLHPGSTDPEVWEDKMPEPLPPSEPPSDPEPADEKAERFAELEAFGFENMIWLGGEWWRVTSYSTDPDGQERADIERAAPPVPLQPETNRQQSVDSADKV